MNNIYRLLLLVLVLLPSCGSPAAPTAPDAARQRASGWAPSPTPAVTETPSPASPHGTLAPDTTTTTAVPAPPSASVMPAPRETRTIVTPTRTSTGKADADPIVIHVQNLDYQPGFVIHCPENVVCDQTIGYRAYLYADDRVSLYLSFEPQVIGTSSYAELVQHLGYIDMEVRFPERTTATSRFFYANRRPVEQLSQANADGVTVEFSAYEQNRLRGRVSGTATRITEFRTSNEPGCVVDDQGGICYIDKPASIPFVITFDLTLIHASGAPGA